MYYHVISFTNTLEANIYDFWSMLLFTFKKQGQNHVGLFYFHIMDMK